MFHNELVNSLVSSVASWGSCHWTDWTTGVVRWPLVIRLVRLAWDSWQWLQTDWSRKMVSLPWPLLVLLVDRSVLNQVLVSLIGGATWFVSVSLVTTKNMTVVSHPWSRRCLCCIWHRLCHFPIMPYFRNAPLSSFKYSINTHTRWCQKMNCGCWVEWEIYSTMRCSFSFEVDSAKANPTFEILEGSDGYDKISFKCVFVV